MYYIIKFQLSKSEGTMPSASDVTVAHPGKSYDEVVKDAMRFSFNNDNDLLPVVDWKLIDDGKESLLFSGSEMTGYPKPVIWLQLEDEVDIEEPDQWFDALSSDYVIEIEGVNMAEPFYLQDHNGYSIVESAEWLADEIWGSLQSSIVNMEDNQVSKLSDKFLITRQRSEEDEAIALSALIKNDNKEFVFTWFFEGEEALADFDFYNKEYSDSNGCSCAEENAMVYMIHQLCCQSEE